MSLIPSGLSVQEAYRRYRNGQIVVNRKYQRKLVWTQNEKRMLIDSILHEYPIPLILFAETQSEDGPVYEILDGMQRLNTICAMANIGPDSEGYIYIGVADKEKDAERIKILDGIEPMNISNHFVVGVEREAIILGISVENYCRKVLSIIQESKLSKDLKIAVLTKIDIIDYKGLRILIILTL